MYKRILKPLSDFILALIAFIILLPILLIVAIAIKIESRGPVLFKQTRIGLKGSEFKIYKFRSMISDQTPFKQTFEIYEDDPRITKVGKFIRKTSLDELPQLLNIIKGEMSFIGPRPPLPFFPKKYDEYTESEKQRFTVKPGISGLAQVRCREIHDWEVNIRIDLAYVNDYSFIYDFKLFMTSLFSFFNTNNIYRRR
jgi:undecaprenyl phosphate N,N'-diacetylbacillosamine 1-phosphate transferase